jgi:hypothetical protein
LAAGFLLAATEAATEELTDPRDRLSNDLRGVTLAPLLALATDPGRLLALTLTLTLAFPAAVLEAPTEAAEPEVLAEPAVLAEPTLDRRLPPLTVTFFLAKTFFLATGLLPAEVDVPEEVLPREGPALEEETLEDLRLITA